MEAAIAGIFVVALCVIGALIPARHEIIPRRTAISPQRGLD